LRYVNMGNTGLRVSRVCLGMMSFGRHESRKWALDEDEAEPIVRRAVEGGINFFDTADVYNGGESEAITGRLVRKLFGMREEYVVATKVHGRTMPGEMAVDSRASTSLRRSTHRWSGSSSTTSTSIRSTAGTTPPRSRRQWRHCTTW
jgi:aryl-alcohol dehydrogenase-like predicted oxidoreductase